MVRWGKTNCSNCSKLNLVGIHCHCWLFVISTLEAMGFLPASVDIITNVCDYKRFNTNFLRLEKPATSRMPIRDVARRINLDWHTVKELEKEYMRERLTRAAPRARV